LACESGQSGKPEYKGQEQQQRQQYRPEKTKLVIKVLQHGNRTYINLQIV